MPLISGLERAVRRLRTELEAQIRKSSDDAAIADWLVERYEISIANAQAIVELFRAQLSISDIPIGRKMLIERYRDGERTHYFFHSLIGRSANDALSRIVALCV